MIRLFRDIDIGDRAGDFEIPLTDDINKSINEGLDKAYNQGLEHSIRVLRGELYEEINAATEHWNKHHRTIISQLESLKKKV